jgi:hypothetical protein
MKRLIPHICIVLGLVVLTLFILVQFNPGIAVSSFYTIAMYAFCIAAFVTSGVLIASNRRNKG